ncbi:MAG: porin family protein [Sphingomonas bacterium]|nr:porin family protein [Sphingomonas bacterium]MDB5682612.1 porin family protein [Sphingomonas bacterium]MDB5716654.1 porin family protein [Sphingomonas bacterium]
MRSFAYPALLATVAAMATAAPALAQESAPFTGARVEGIVGWDRLQDRGHNDDVMYGVSGGYDMQMGSALVGIEAEAADSNNKTCFGAQTAADPRVCAKAARDLYVGGRVGTVVGGRTLLYAKAGYTNARVKLTSDDGTNQVTLARDNLNGARVGAGAEYAVGPNSFVKAEYRYSNYEQGLERHQLVGGFGFRF